MCPYEFCTSSPAPPYRSLTASASRSEHTGSNFGCTMRIGCDVFDAANGVAESVDAILEKLVAVSGANGYEFKEPTNRKCGVLLQENL